MNKNMTRLSHRYLTALRKYLALGAGAGLQPALALGRQAVILGLETLDLARIHEQALVTLELSKCKNGSLKRAEIFFTEAITPIVETHRAARHSKIQLHQLNEMLGRRTLELAATNLQLKRGVIQRKHVEAALKKSSLHYARLLKDSLHLHKNLRKLTHQVLAAQEEKRKKISLELQDEVAQILLGINVRLLSLKQESQVNTSGIKQEIASTQRLVAKSAKSVRRVARKFRKI